MSRPLRLLDLGCADAAIPAWLAGQLNGRGLHIDGIDLDHGLLERARARAAELGIPGEYRYGNALDAPNMFAAGSYDAVVAYELIEHVPDMSVFLDATEQMVRPGGVVFVSTPDGTFGQGHNPHHLRVLRAADLADLLRRRGRLVDMEVGADGVTAAAYTPGPRREDVAIYTGPNWNRWAPLDIERKGLGGSETAATRLAEAMSELGFVVTVYGEVEEMCFRDVIFRDYRTFDPLERRAAVICSRIPEIADRPINAATRLLWVHDVDCGDRLTPARADPFDHILALSRWHENHLKGRYPFAADRVLRIRNGIHHRYFAPSPWEQRTQRVVYSSSPDRGLDILLELWPKIRAKAPDAELAFCYPDVYDAVADQQPEIAAHRDRVRELADQPGVVRLGALPQHQLAELMCNSRVWAHPSWMGQHDAPFEETSCIGVMEAQAAGCYVVASNWGALSENVLWGAKLNGDAPGPRWRAGLVRSIVRGLTDPATGAKAVERGPAAVAHLDWAGVAEQLGVLIGAQDTRRG